MLDDTAVRSWDFGRIEQTYSHRDTMLYALGIGLGADPLDEGELRFVYEKNLQAVPSMASVLGTPGFWWRDPKTGADWVKVVHGEQALKIFRPVPAEATLVAVNRVVSITDKGAGKGAIAVVTRDLYDKATNTLFAQGRSVSFLRGDGGFSERSGKSDPPSEALPKVPERPADFSVSLPTLPRQALLYRLNGDYNVLHSDPEVARAAGFPRPILHGLCTYGMAAHALLKTVCRYEAARVSALAVRFSSPVFPGETVTFDFWESGSGRLQLQARVEARQITVLSNGVAELV
jgi:acyl dehydratase